MLDLIAGPCPGPSGGDPVYPPTPPCEDYTATIPAPDFAIEDVVPLVVYKDQRILIGVNIVNHGLLRHKTSVTVTVGAETLTMNNIDVPANGNHALSFGYFTPRTTGTPAVKVVVNPNHPASEAPRSITCNTCRTCDTSISNNGAYSPQEYSYADNTWTGTMTINKLPDIINPANPAPQPANPQNFVRGLPRIKIYPIAPSTGADPNSSYTPPNGDPTTIGNNRTIAEWIDSTPTINGQTGGTDIPGTDMDKLYNAKIDLDFAVYDDVSGREVPTTALKSGYGFKIRAKVKITTDYPIAEKVEAPKKVVVYVPEYRYDEQGVAVELERTDGGSAYARETVWEFPENSSSGTGAKKWYVPVWWPDGSEYTFLVAAKGAITPGGEITAAKAYTIAIDDNMYTDDYTKN
ncbi:MAG: hypothetical protein Q4E65_03595 [Clostridia bacterium]|nr:hypothetical protein [Clostridia bacterium]